MTEVRAPSNRARHHAQMQPPILFQHSARLVLVTMAVSSSLDYSPQTCSTFDTGVSFPSRALRSLVPLSLPASLKQQPEGQHGHHLLLPPHPLMRQQLQLNRANNKLVSEELFDGTSLTWH